MSAKPKILFLFTIMLVFFAACRKDKLEEESPKNNNNGNEWIYNPTAVQLKLPSRFPPPLEQSIQLTREGISLGRHLFYDPILSGDSTQSCASCHNQKLGFTDNKNKLSVGIQGLEGKFNAMALINLAWRSSLFWNGRSPNLIQQALEPVRDPIEMHETWPRAIEKLKRHSKYPKMFYEAFGTTDIDSLLAAEAIAQFEMTLISGNSKYDKFRRGETILTPEETLGLDIFRAEPRRRSIDPPGADCFHCHNVEGHGPNTSMLFTNNGLDANPQPGLSAVTGKSEDIGKFIVPTLRNIEVTGPYMHDGRFDTLEDVIDHYANHVKPSPTLDPIMTKDGGLSDGLMLTNKEKAALVAFLKTLTDEEFLNNPDFSNPFE